MPLIHEATPKAKDAIRNASEDRRMPSSLVCNPRIVWMIVAVTGFSTDWLMLFMGCKARRTGSSEEKRTRWERHVSIKLFDGQVA